MWCAECTLPDAQSYKDGQASGTKWKLRRPIGRAHQFLVVDTDMMDTLRLPAHPAALLAWPDFFPHPALVQKERELSPFSLREKGWG